MNEGTLGAGSASIWREHLREACWYHDPHPPAVAMLHLCTAGTVLELLSNVTSTKAFAARLCRTETVL